MAPRGRPKVRSFSHSSSYFIPPFLFSSFLISQKGERRMDAALDAMIPYGFPNKLVRQTVDQLLKVMFRNFFFLIIITF